MEKKKNQERMREYMCCGLLVLLLGCFFTFQAHISAHRAASQVHLLRGQQIIKTITTDNNSDKEQDGWILPEYPEFDQDFLASSANHLILVAGHSVLVAGNVQDADHDEDVWHLLDYQKSQGMPQAIVGHLRAGIEAARADPQSLLIFSGGQTRPKTGPLSEGASYFVVCDALRLWPQPDEDSTLVRARTTVEEYARDSFENVLFSIARFREVTGRYPQKITVVSFTFKQHRFETLHMPALQWPLSRFEYIGRDPPPSTGFQLEKSTRGEMENSLQPFQTDPYGCHSDKLQHKRLIRNPFRRTTPYSLSCPEMKELLAYCGPGIIPKTSVPWNVG